ncbi:MAG: hypothetical protein Q8Q00_02925 [Dehalococcoidia bacterium]|nr:hypothetical protein [Dehalococcoidia bacterium]
MSRDDAFPKSVFILIALAIGASAMLAIGVLSLNSLSPSAADAVAGHGDCTGGVVGILPDSADQATYDAGSDIVTGVCIKSGVNMWGGNHSSLFTSDATNILACYSVSGIGSSSVTVLRTGAPSSTCQAISHIDVIVETPTPTSTPRPTPTPTPIPTPTPTPPAATSPTATAVLGEVRGPTALPATGGTPANGDSSSLPWLAAAIGGLAMAAVGGFWAHKWGRTR